MVIFQCNILNNPMHCCKRIYKNIVYTGALFLYFNIYIFSKLSYICANINT